MWDIIVNSTNIPPNAIQRNVFYWIQGDPCPQPVQLNTSLLEPCKYLHGYDYFEVFQNIILQLILPNSNIILGKRISLYLRLCFFGFCTHFVCRRGLWCC